MALRVTLRPFVDADAPALDPWLAEAVAAVDGARPGAATPGTLGTLTAQVAERWPGADLRAVEAAGQGVVGVLVWRLLAGNGAEAAGVPAAGAGSAHPAMVVIDALAVRRERRNLGYGAEAVYRLEEMHAGATLYAATPRVNGLAIYFWLRTGYRPVRPDESEALAGDPERFWMVQGFSADRSGASSAG